MVARGLQLRDHARAAHVPMPMIADDDVTGMVAAAANVTGLFKGNWTVGLESAIGELDFAHDAGRLALQLESEPTLSPDVAYVSGHLRLRDGTYITDRSLHYYVHGFHLRRLGWSLLTANRLESLK